MPGGNGGDDVVKRTDAEGVPSMTPGPPPDGPSLVGRPGRPPLAGHYLDPVTLRRIGLCAGDVGPLGLPRPLPPHPTDHPPGTEGKVAVMAWRWENEYHIHHPGDARLSDGGEDDPYADL